MKELIKNLETLLGSIGRDELRKNSKASAKASEIKRMILKLKSDVQIGNLENQRVLNYLSSRMLLEN